MNTTGSTTPLKRVLTFLGRTLALLMALLLCVPVLLLPLATNVPAWVWIPLAVATVALLILFFRLKPAWKGTAVRVGRRTRGSCVGRGGLASLRHHATYRRRAGQAAVRQHRHAGGGHAQRQPAVDLRSGAGHHQTRAVVSGRRPGRQPIGDRALRPERAGGAFRGRQLGTAGGGQVLRRREPRHAHP